MQPLDEERARLLAEWLRKAEDDVQVVDLLLASEAGLANPLVRGGLEVKRVAV